ncbi:MAG: histone deacetylase [Vicinamibacterales bacterium]
MDIVYSDRYQVDIGAHVFHMGKYAQVRDGLVASGLADPAALVEPAPAGWDDLALVHTRDYLEKTRAGGFRASELALLELPWSPEVAEGFRLMAGGTIAAARLAVAARRRAEGGAGGAAAGEPRLFAAANLGGGFHHAFPSHGEGFCLYNDVAVAIRALQRDGTIGRAAVVDADVHQGNGTAFIFEGDASVFTFSIHQEHNYPHVKPRGSLDVGLPDGTGDREYLHALERALPAVVASRPDLIVYVAGADPYVEDQLGGLCLTYEGLRGRDSLVLSTARDAGVPAVIVFAGGYARRVEDTAAIHIATIEEAVRLGA